MGNDSQNTKFSAEDWAIELAEQGFSNPAADNMQFLQSTLNSTGSESVGAASSGYFSTSAKSLPNTSHPFGNSFSGLAPAYSGAGLLGAVAVTDMAGLGSAMAMAAQVATAAPVTFGKNAVGDSALLSSVGDKANMLIDPLDLQDSLPLTQAAMDSNSNSPVSNWMDTNAVFFGFNSLSDAPDSTDALMSLIAALGQNPSPENLQAAIDAVSDQIALLNSTFDPVFEGLDGEIQSQIAAQEGLSSTDLGVSIFDDAGSVSSTLSDLIGSIDVANNPQLSSLLNMDSTFDNISTLVGSLPDLDLSPVINPITDIVGGITDPITDIVGGITDPITDIVGGVTDPITDIVGGVTDPITDIVGGITDPITDIVGGITDPITDIVGGITDPITDIVGGVTDPITDIVGGVTDPITDIVGGITDPITEPVIDIVDGLLPDLGLLSGLSTGGESADGNDLLGLSNSGISSTAGTEGGALDGLLGALDPNK